jgi:hypothetical protein
MFSMMRSISTKVSSDLSVKLLTIDVLIPDVFMASFKLTESTLEQLHVNH